jgi:hypothetical protein
MSPLQLVQALLDGQAAPAELRALVASADDALASFPSGMTATPGRDSTCNGSSAPTRWRTSHAWPHEAWRSTPRLAPCELRRAPARDPPAARKNTAASPNQAGGAHATPSRARAEALAVWRWDWQPPARRQRCRHGWVHRRRWLAAGVSVSRPRVHASAAGRAVPERRSPRASHTAHPLAQSHASRRPRHLRHCGAEKEPPAVAPLDARFYSSTMSMSSRRWLRPSCRPSRGWRTGGPHRAAHRQAWPRGACAAGFSDPTVNDRMLLAAAGTWDSSRHQGRACVPISSASRRGADIGAGACRP